MTMSRRTRVPYGAQHKAISRKAAQLAARFRPRVEVELEELADASEASAEERGPVALDQQSVGRLSRVGAMQVQAMAQESERRRQTRIAALKATLTRIDEGDFGECADCGELIPEKRLEVDPTVPLCVTCATGGGR